MKYVEAIEDIRHIFDKNTDTFVFGLFRGHDLIESEGMEGYSIDPWGQFQAVADALRG